MYVHVPSFAYTCSNPAPDSSLCRAAAASASAAAPRYCVHFSCCSQIALQQHAHAAPRLRPLQLLLAACVRFSCCSPLASASAAARRLRPLQPIASGASAACCSPIASASALASYSGSNPPPQEPGYEATLAAAPRLRPLMLPDCYL